MEAYTHNQTGEILCRNVQGRQPSLDAFIINNFGSLEAFEALGFVAEDFTLTQLTESDAITLLGRDIEALRQAALGRLNTDLHRFLDEQGLDQGSQTSFLALYSDVQDDLIIAGALTLKKNELKAAIREVWAYIQGVVMPYYYGVKSTIEQHADPELVAWDFQPLASENPGHTLRSLLGGE